MGVIPMAMFRPRKKRAKVLIMDTEPGCVLASCTCRNQDRRVQLADTPNAPFVSCMMDQINNLQISLAAGESKPFLPEMIPPAAVRTCPDCGEESTGEYCSV